jgi:pimeloyl-ACP methyl ester carboxylesterase
MLLLTSERQKMRQTIFLPQCNYHISYQLIKPTQETKQHTLVFLHHATGSAADWRDQLSFFSQQHGYTCLAYDRFGFGYSIPSNNTTTSSSSSSSSTYIKNIMMEHPFDYYDRGLEELNALLTELNLSQVVLIGHSDGATLSLLAASGQHSNMSDINSSSSTSDHTLQQLKRRVVAVVAESPHIYYDTNSADSFDIFVNTTMKTDKFWIVTAREHQSVDNAKLIVNRWLKLWWHSIEWRKWNDTSCLKHIECPVLVIHGQLDIFWPPSHSQFIVDEVNRNKGLMKVAQFLLFESVGHTAHREQISKYNQSVLQFLQQQQQQQQQQQLTSKL